MAFVFACGVHSVQLGDGVVPETRRVDQVYWFLSYLTDFREGSRRGKSTITTKDMKTPYEAVSVCVSGVPRAF